MLPGGARGRVEGLKLRKFGGFEASELLNVLHSALHLACRNFREIPSHKSSNF